MSFLADFHVHLYPCFDLLTALKCADANLAIPESSTVNGAKTLRLLFIVNPWGDNTFDKLLTGNLDSPVESLAISPISPQALSASLEKRELILILGQQIVTKERLEVLAYFLDHQIPDGLAISDVLSRIKSQDALPVINWAPGKWMFSRGRIIRGLINSADPSEFLLCDTSLRPRGWPESSIMQEARRKGFRIVAGSDPFPFPGQERLIGKYGISGTTNLNVHELKATLREALFRTDADLLFHGARESTPRAAARLLRLRSMKK